MKVDALKLRVSIWLFGVAERVHRCGFYHTERWEAQRREILRWHRILGRVCDES